MTDSAAPTPENARPSNLAETEGAPKPRRKMPAWLLRTIVVIAALVILVIAYLIASVTVPLTWAHAIRNQVGGQLGNSIPLGMFYGFVFSFVPVVVGWQAHYKKMHKWVRVGILVVALLLTIPNLLTLAVLHGNSKTAADARAIWATSANWFGTWSQIFMVVGVACAVALIVLTRIWLRRGKRVRQVKAAEKLVRDNDAAKARADANAARAAEKQARDDARAAEKAARQSARDERRNGPA
ncbi:hypothetical protein AL755_08100 [Arthrobacter sp. ERGS1:01]|uniref:hypothetical protein n=1 Tax=Arthrobacter sp. ERGS1:01 TaxID=1704044 RepID=UPI0006B5C7EF|nr:hypothetical protein [Arthrobacter sp. ERGS1:01]ALE05447.1 hypothetical protein AL755_08100 [Arthrobacter sp. ERGS1:01]